MTLTDTLDTVDDLHAVRVGSPSPTCRGQTPPAPLETVALSRCRRDGQPGRRTPDALVAVQVTSAEQAGTKSHRLFVSLPGVLDVQVDVYLLRRAVWPVGRDVVRCQLGPDPLFAARVDRGRAA
jgi:hypothetical protein